MNLHFFYPALTDSYCYTPRHEEDQFMHQRIGANRRRERYNVDIGDLHSLCESNYLRLLRVFPAYEKSNMTEVATGHLVLVLEVVERTRYTTLMRVTQRGQHGLPAMGLDVRLYHDASMAEIIAFQRHRRLAGRYDYPNPNMYQRDEKVQQNRYLAELLESCLAEGRVNVDVSSWVEHDG
ncbi:MAG: DUF1249 domain-containing protein [Luminiphilus sp.]